MSTPPNTNTQTPSSAAHNSWPKTRILFLLAGTITLIGVALSATLSPWYLLIPTMVGANQLLMVAIGWCPMSLLLDRLGIGAPQSAPISY